MSRSRKKFLALAALPVFLTGLAVAQADTWQLDTNHSAAQFAVKHMLISTVRGHFNKIDSGTVVYDPNDITKTQIEATIDAASINTRVDARDNDLRGANYFDVQKFPKITFKSKKVESAGTGKAKVTGDLTIHGVTKEVVLDVDGPSAVAKDPRGGQHVGASATTKISRKDFGVSGGAGMVGDDVTITLDIELVKR